MSDIVGHHCVRREDDEANVWDQTDFHILKCRGCGAVYFQTDFVFSEDYSIYEQTPLGGHDYEYNHTVKYWPAPVKRVSPEWIQRLSRTDSNLISLVREIYSALDGDLRVLAAIGVRTTFDCASELLGIDQALKFFQKLDALVASGRIGAEEREALDVLTDAGSAAAHRGWKPDVTQLDKMMSILEAFLYRAFILPEDAQELRGGVPPRPKRS